jgi:hypothetical protein
MKPDKHVDKWGTECWCLNGELHREDGPAVTYSDGTKYWYRNGKFHREDGPAIIYTDGTEWWYLNGKEVDPFDPMKLLIDEVEKLQLLWDITDG